MTSISYQYKFTNADSIYSRIKEEFSSYFESGLLDDSLLDLYTKDCIDHLGRGMLKLSHTILSLKNHVAELPDDLAYIREVWLCHEHEMPFTLPGAVYQQKIKDTAYKIWEDVDVHCNPCQTCKNPDIIEAIYKIKNTVYYSWKRERLLLERPFIEKHGEQWVYTIEDCELHSPIENGTLNLVYYQQADTDDDGLQIPDNYYIRKYIEEYLKYKLYFILFNKVTDETFNQIQAKMMMQKQIADESFIEAKIEAKKDTAEKKIRRINKQRRDLRKYEQGFERPYHNHRHHW